jgi:hypothetical protein
VPKVRRFHHPLMGNPSTPSGYRWRPEQTALRPLPPMLRRDWQPQRMRRGSCRDSQPKGRPLVEDGDDGGSGRASLVAELNSRVREADDSKRADSAGWQSKHRDGSVKDRGTQLSDICQLSPQARSVYRLKPHRISNFGSPRQAEARPSPPT